MSRKHLTVLGEVLGLLVLLATPAMANLITGASASADCRGYTLTVNLIELTPGTAYTINYSFTLTCGGLIRTVPGSIVFTATGTTATKTATGTWASGTPLSTNCTLTGTATLTETGQTIAITINGSSSATLSCGSTGTPKNFSIGPSSMEGDLHINPGDWISGGYNFKFIDKNHGATSYGVTATVTVPVICPDGIPDENIVIPLGTPGLLDGGGVTSTTFAIAAGDTNNHATNDQNSNLAWEGAVRARAGLCDGHTGRNQTGAVFNITVTQSPHVGLVDWQFHYRDPAAKGKPNTDCTNTSDPNRARADVCGASWSQTLRDP